MKTPELLTADNAAPGEWDAVAWTLIEEAARAERLFNPGDFSMTFKVRGSTLLVVHVEKGPDNGVNSYTLRSDLTE